MTRMKYTQKWDLSQSLNGAYPEHRKIEKYLQELKKEIESFDVGLPESFGKLEMVSAKLHEALSLICCMTAINSKDTEATRLDALSEDIAALIENIADQIAYCLKETSDKKFNEILNEYPNHKYILEEIRRIAKEKLPLNEEKIITDLTPSGHSSMTTLYYGYIGEMKFSVDGKNLPISKVENLLDESEGEVRKKAIIAMETTFSQHENIFATILNSIIDFRIRVQEKRKYKTPLHDSLNDNRISKETLDAMWSAVKRHRGSLCKFMDKKAKLLGKEKLSYSDIHAPIGNREESNISWEEGCDLIVEQFKHFSPKMSAFAQMALEKGWVDSQILDSKRAGGFCTMFPLSGYSRIFMSYTNSYGSLSTLAHELGHAYHSWVLRSRPPMLQDYPMNIAETASTFCEMLITDASYKRETDPKKKKILLDQKLSRHMIFCTDLYARYDFDLKLHEKRSSGFISADELTQMTIASQKDAFNENLNEYFGHFWCYKMHQYFTDVSFYNWTYSFGYLFSLNLYLTLKDDKSFEQKYIALLFDSGAMSIEDLATKHLGVDIRSTDFWSAPLKAIESEINTYLSL